MISSWMRSMDRQEQFVALSIVAFSVAYIAWRAVIVPIQYDEAVTIMEAADKNPFTAFTSYSQGTNNHPLVSFFASILAGVGPWREWTFRIPSVIAAAAFFLGAMHLGALVLPRWWTSVALLLIAGMPIFADYLPMARGYSLGIASTTWAIALLVDALHTDSLSRRTAWAVGALLALAMISVPSYLLSTLTIVVSYGLVCVRNGTFAAQGKRIALAVSVAGMLTIVAYLGILTKVAEQAFIVTSATAESNFLALKTNFIRSLSPLGLWAGVIFVAATAWCVATELRKATSGAHSQVGLFLALVLVLYMPSAMLGYARNHLLLPLLAVFVIAKIAPSTRVGTRAFVPWTLALYGACGLLINPTLWILTEPEIKPVSGMKPAIAAMHESLGEPPCFLLEVKGMFLFPYRFYERAGAVAPSTTDCEYVIMERSELLAYLAQFEMHPDVTKPYGLAMYPAEAVGISDEARAQAR